MMPVQVFSEEDAGGAVRGFLHSPAKGGGDALVLTHGAGSNCQAPLLVGLATVFEEAGFTVLRCDLPYRQARRFGPPPPGSAAADREGLQRAVTVLRRRAAGRVFLGGHSYGGRQASVLAAAEPGVTEGLLLLSYPLHPPKSPAQLRTQHFPKLTTTSLFVHGTRDPFGSLEEMQAALAGIPGPVKLIPVDGAGHDLSVGRRATGPDLPAMVLSAFQDFHTSPSALSSPRGTESANG